MTDPFIDLGSGCHVRLSEVVAYHDEYDSVGDQLTISSFVDDLYDPEAKAVVLLRNGALIPSYVTARAITQRIARAVPS